MCEEKRSQFCLVKAENEVHSDAMDKFSNEKQAKFKLFNLWQRFFNLLKIVSRLILAAFEKPLP
jgi:hypothetical protein